VVRGVQQHSGVAVVRLLGLRLGLGLAAGAAHRFSGFTGRSEGGLILCAVVRTKESSLLGLVPLVGVELFPLFRVLDLGIEVGGGAAVRADEYRV